MLGFRSWPMTAYPDDGGSAVTTVSKPSHQFCSDIQVYARSTLPDPDLTWPSIRRRGQGHHITIICQRAAACNALVARNDV